MTKKSVGVIDLTPDTNIPDINGTASLTAGYLTQISIYNIIKSKALEPVNHGFRIFRSKYGIS